MKKIRYLLARYRVFLGHLLALIFIIFVKPEKNMFYVGVPISILGEIIRTWASGYIHKNETLARDGPYSLVRNPLYLGSFLVGSGIAITGGWVWFLVFVLFFIPVYVNLILFEEEKLKELFGAEFENYTKEVPRLFPKLRKFNFKGGYNFSLAMKEHKEWQTWLGILVVFVLLFIKSKMYL